MPIDVTLEPRTVATIQASRDAFVKYRTEVCETSLAQSGMTQAPIIDMLADDVIEVLMGSAAGELDAAIGEDAEAVMERI